MLRYISVVITVLALVVTSVACASQPASPAPAASGSQPAAPAATAKPPEKLEKVKVGYATIAVSFAPVWMAAEEKLYQKYGLDAEVVFINGGPVLASAMLSGEVQFGQFAAPAPMNATLEGGGTPWIASAMNTPVMQLLTAPGIKKVEDLKGKNIGVSKPGTTSDAFGRLVLQKYNLVPEKDVTFVITGETGQTLAAMQSGSLSAAMLGPVEWVAIRKMGGSKLYDAADLGVPYPMSGAVAVSSYIKDHPDTVRKFVQAYTEANYIIKTDEKKFKALITKYTQNTDQEIIDELYNAYVKYYEKVPYPTEKAMASAAEMMAVTNAKAKTFPLKDYFNDTFVRELDQSGFITKLYGN